MVSWGKNASGTRRFRCLDCQQTFTWKQKQTNHLVKNKLLQLWLEGITAKHLSQYSEQATKTILRSLRRSLKYFPSPQPQANLNSHLIIDATWFGRKHCLIVYWDPDLKRVQWWRYSNREHDCEIVEDLVKLKKAGVICSSITSDGSQGVNRAVNIVYPIIPHQRCVTHIQRKGFTLLTKNPKTLAGQELRRLFEILSRVATEEDKYNWISYFKDWCHRWDRLLKEKNYLAEKRKWWYKHKTLRRTRSIVLKALPNLFHYITNPEIPKTTNGLEGRFGALKQHYRQHRGLAKSRRESYLSWYLTLAINHEKPTRFVL